MRSRAYLVAGVIIACSCSFLLLSCSKSETIPTTNSSQNVTIQSEFSQPESERQEKEEQSSANAVLYQPPEDGYYSSDDGEILNIVKLDDGTYTIEYSIYKLLYIESATGTFNSETGKLHFIGEDDNENSVEADIENEGAYLQVTIIKSNYDNIIGMKQDFFLVSKQNINE